MAISTRFYVGWPPLLSMLAIPAESYLLVDPGWQWPLEDYIRLTLKWDRGTMLQQGCWLMGRPSPVAAAVHARHGEAAAGTCTDRVEGGPLYIRIRAYVAALGSIHRCCLW